MSFNNVTFISLIVQYEIDSFYIVRLLYIVERNTELYWTRKELKTLN
jgi:hypothetical protein